MELYRAEQSLAIECVAKSSMVAERDECVVAALVGCVHTETHRQTVSHSHTNDDNGRRSRR